MAIARIGLITGLLALGACGGDEPARPKAAAKPKEKIPHCFFKDADLKDWKVAEKPGGSVVVSGRAYRSDGRYKALLLEPKIEGRVAVVRPTIALNDTGFSAEENWWDVSAKVPSAGIHAVEVRCGKKMVARLPLASLKAE